MARLQTTRRHPVKNRRQKMSSVAELQRTKEDLEDLEFFIREFTAFLPLAVCTVNPLGIIIDTNKTFQDLAKYKPIEIVGESLVILFVKKKEIETTLNVVTRREFVVSKELTLVTKQKERVPVSVAISSRKDREGNFIGYFIGITDITELKTLQEEMEEKVKERTKKLQEKMADLERFQKLAVGRELKMIELKKEIEKLKKELEEIKGRH